MNGNTEPANTITKILEARDGLNQKIANGGSTTSTVVKFHLHADTEGSGHLTDILDFQCSLDDQPYSPCPGPRSHAEYDGLSPGNHTLKAKALIEGGETDKAEEASFTWTIIGDKNV